MRQRNGQGALQGDAALVGGDQVALGDVIFNETAVANQNAHARNRLRHRKAIQGKDWAIRAGWYACPLGPVTRSGGVEELGRCRADAGCGDRKNLIRAKVYGRGGAFCRFVEDAEIEMFPPHIWRGFQSEH